MPKRGKLEILGDFTSIDKAYAEGRITPAEHQAMFAKARLHSVRGDIMPFAIGGSDFAAILGKSKYTTPELLIMQKLNPGKYQEPVYGGLDYIFQRGHFFEEGIARAGALILSKRIGKPVKYEPCSMQFRNTRWPNIVANIDGFYIIEGERYIVECKAIGSWADNARQYAQGNVPLDYLYQIKCYNTVLGVKGTYNVAAQGLEESDFNIEFVPYDDEDIKLLDQAQETIENVKSGIMPSNKDYKIPKAAKKRAEKILYATLDPTLKPKSLDKKSLAKFADLDRLNSQIEPIAKSIKSIEAPYKAEIKKLEKEMEKACKDLYKSKAALEDEKSTICSTFLPQIGNAAMGYFRDDENEYEIIVERKFSFGQAEKSYFREKYPAVYDEISSLKPKFEYKYNKRKI